MNSPKSAESLDRPDVLNVSSESDSLPNPLTTMDIDHDELALAIAQSYELDETVSSEENSSDEEDEEESDTHFPDANKSSSDIAKDKLAGPESVVPQTEVEKQRRNRNFRRKKNLKNPSSDECPENLSLEDAQAIQSVIELVPTTTLESIDNCNVEAENDVPLTKVKKKRTRHRKSKSTEIETGNAEETEANHDVKKNKDNREKNKERAERRKKKKTQIVDELKVSFEKMKVNNNSGAMVYKPPNMNIGSPGGKARTFERVFPSRAAYSDASFAGDGYYLQDDLKNYQQSHVQSQNLSSVRRINGNMASSINKQDMVRCSPRKDANNAIDESAPASPLPKNSYTKLLMEHRRKVKDIKYKNENIPNRMKDRPNQYSPAQCYVDYSLQGMLNSSDQQYLRDLTEEFHQLREKQGTAPNSVKKNNNGAAPKVSSQSMSLSKTRTESLPSQTFSSKEIVTPSSENTLSEENKTGRRKPRSRNKNKQSHLSNEDHDQISKVDKQATPAQSLNISITVDEENSRTVSAQNTEPRPFQTESLDAAKLKPKKEVQRNKNKNASSKQSFEPYMDMYAVSERLKRGQLIQGPIRINPKNFEEAYVPLPDGTSDIFINGLTDRNRALNGDIVAVQLHDKDNWRVHAEEVEEYEKNCHKDLTEADTEETDSDPDVIIEEEETVGSSQSITKQLASGKSLASSSSKVTASSGCDKEPSTSKRHGVKCKQGMVKKKHTLLKDIKTDGSPAAKKLFRNSAASDKFLQCTGKVVAIIEKVHSRACTGNIKLLKDKNPDKALFAPTDHRLPRINVAMADCPKDFYERPGDYNTTLFVARITDWKENSTYAQGHLARSLGEAGQIEPETEGMLIEYDVDSSEFPEEVLTCLPTGSPWKIPPEEYEKRRNFTKNCVFTIDPATARDLDDALSCEELGNGLYEVGVHIADVSYFLHEDTDLDRIASGRATSVYLVQKVIPMLPRLLCEQLCSLNPDEERLTFSVVWKMTEKGEILEEWFGRSIIKSCVKLSYDHAQGFIEAPERRWTNEELPPISPPFTVANIKERVLNFHKLAQHLRKFRFDNGALRLDQVKLQYTLDKDTGLPNGYSVYQQRDSNRLVEEFMLLANMAVAHKIKEAFPKTALLRRHPPPQNKMIDELEDLCTGLGVPLDCSSSGTIQQSLQQYYGNDEYSRGRLQVLVTLCSKPMQMAKYFAVGSLEDETMFHHYALSVPLYTHFTSPIRRYADVIVHRHLASALGYCAEINKTPLQVQRQAEICNLKKTNSKKVQELSQELYFSVFVKEAGPFEEKGMVMGVMDKAFDVFILELGVAKRVYVDKLKLKGYDFQKEQKCPTLTLTWEADENCREETVQKINIFSLVHCVLFSEKEPLKWSAIIKRPQL